VSLSLEFYFAMIESDRSSAILYLVHNSVLVKFICLFMEHYQVTVKVRDYGTPPLSTNCFLFVTILDINDNKPVFDYTAAYYSTVTNTASLSIGNRIYRVFAYDVDNGVNGTVVYSLTSVLPPCQNCFTVDSPTGWIRRGSQSALVSAYLYICRSS